MTFVSLVRSITSISRDAQPKRGWQARLNGVLIPRALSSLSVAECLSVFSSLFSALVEHDGVALLEIHNPSFGTWAYGKTAGGWDGWAFHEIGGGGSVIVPHVTIEGMIYIGVVEQKRDLQGGMVYNLPRGFVEPGESHLQAAKREGGEELGIDSAKLKLTHLQADPGNPNSAFFETLDEPGVQCYGFAVDPAWLERREDGNYRFKAGLLQTDADAKAKKMGELILGSVFLPFYRASKLGDHFTPTGMARLFGHMLEEANAKKAVAEKSAS